MKKLGAFGKIFFDFRTKLVLRKHVEAVHEKTIPHIPCSMCSARFRSNSCLKRHVMSVHEKSKPYKCDMCESAFSQVWQFRMNIFKRM